MQAMTEGHMQLYIFMQYLPHSAENTKIFLIFVNKDVLTMVATLGRSRLEKPTPKIYSLWQTNGI